MILKKTTPLIWLTGLSGAGKTTLANALNDDLIRKGLSTELIDGDEIRKLFPQTGFSRSDRHAHICRVAYMASRLQHHNILPIVSLISPFRESRDFARSLTSNFVEVYLSTPLEVCEARDPKGLYKKARSGEIKNFTGVSDPYEIPTNAEITIDTSQISLSGSVDIVLKWLKLN